VRRSRRWQFSACSRYFPKKEPILLGYKGLSSRISCRGPLKTDMELHNVGENTLTYRRRNRSPDASARPLRPLRVTFTERRTGLQKYLLIALGGALGSIARYWVGSTVAGRMGIRFPYGTLLVNLTACVIIGFSLTYLGRRADLNPAWRFSFPSASLALTPPFQLMNGRRCPRFAREPSFSLRSMPLKSRPWFGCGLGRLSACRCALMPVLDARLVLQ